MSYEGEPGKYRLVRHEPGDAARAASVSCPVCEATVVGRQCSICETILSRDEDLTHDSGDPVEVGEAATAEGAETGPSTVPTEARSRWNMVVIGVLLTLFVASVVGHVIRSLGDSGDEPLVDSSAQTDEATSVEDDRESDIGEPDTAVSDAEESDAGPGEEDVRRPEPSVVPATPRPIPTILVAEVEPEVDFQAECSIEWGGQLATGDTFELFASFPDEDDGVQFEFDHGDNSGRHDGGGYYVTPGSYTPILHWAFTDGRSGESACPSVEVIGDPIGGWTSCVPSLVPDPDRTYVIRNVDDEGLSVRIGPGIEQLRFDDMVEGTEARFVACWQLGSSIWWEREGGGFSSARFIFPT